MKEVSLTTLDISEESVSAQAQECQGLAEILRDLAAQLRFEEHRSRLIALADHLDRQAAKLDPSRNPNPGLWLVPP